MRDKEASRRMALDDVTIIGVAAIFTIYQSYVSFAGGDTARGLGVGCLALIFSSLVAIRIYHLIWVIPHIDKEEKIDD